MKTRTVIRRCAVFCSVAILSVIAAAQSGLAQSGGGCQRGQGGPNMNGGPPPGMGMPSGFVPPGMMNGPRNGPSSNGAANQPMARTPAQYRQMLQSQALARQERIRDKKAAVKAANASRTKTKPKASDTAAPVASLQSKGHARTTCS